jgi:uncharacterized membrane protein YdbT with pleckstrin-like domain
MLKPNKASFIFSSILGYSLFAFILLFSISILSYYLSFNFLIGALVVLLVYLFLVFRSFVIYNKTRYELKQDKFFYYGGGIFSNFEKEVNVKNIVQVNLSVPFFQRKLFDTGSIYVSVAGGSGIFISNVDFPKKIYSDIFELLKAQGFSMTKSKLIQKETPHTLAVFFNTMRSFGLGIVFSYFIFVSVISDILTTDLSLLPVIFFLIGIVLYLFGKSIFLFLDLKRRTYYLYNDIIYFEDGFFNFNYSFIPIENLSDTDLTQNFVDKLFGLYDLQISSVGGYNQVSFSNIVRGKLFESNLKSLLKNKKVESEKVISKKEVNVKSKISSFKVKDLKDVSFKMNIKRLFFGAFFAFISVLIFILIFSFFMVYLGLDEVIYLILFGVMISLFGFGSLFLFKFIQYKFTTYHITKEYLSSNFDFFISRNRQFKLDKVTYFSSVKSPLDRFFNTVSLEFRSVGSTEIMKFEFVDKHFLDKISNIYSFDLKQVSFNKQNYGFFNLIKSSIFFSLFVFLLIIVSSFFSVWFLALFGLILILHLYLKLFFSKSLFGYSKNFIYYKRGLIFVKENFALFDNVKQVSSVKYPLGSVGNLNFNLSGEVYVSQGNNNQALVSNSLFVPFVNDCFSLHDKIDSSLGVKNYNLDFNVSPSPANLLTLFAIPIVTIVYIPIYILIIPVILLKQRRKNFILENDRVLRYKGVFYRTKSSILYDKIDHINKHEGFLNKAYKNYNISIFTIGSSTADLIFKSVPNNHDFYKKLEKKYK